MSLGTTLRIVEEHEEEKLKQAMQQKFCTGFDPKFKPLEVPDKCKFTKPGLCSLFNQEVNFTVDKCYYKEVRFK